jgi:hypothetical protein
MPYFKYKLCLIFICFYWWSQKCIHMSYLRILLLFIPLDLVLDGRIDVLGTTTVPVPWLKSDTASKILLMIKALNPHLLQRCRTTMVDPVKQHISLHLSGVWQYYIYFVFFSLPRCTTCNRFCLLAFFLFFLQCCFSVNIKMKTTLFTAVISVLCNI